MGWGRMLLLGNWGQQMDIEDQREEIASLRRQLETAAVPHDRTREERLARLEKETGELRLYLAAVIRYLGHQGLLRPDDFRKLVEEIDKGDGSGDNYYGGELLR